jgi:hypothetical protein
MPHAPQFAALVWRFAQALLHTTSPVMQVGGRSMGGVSRATSAATSAGTSLASPAALASLASPREPRIGDPVHPTPIAAARSHERAWREGVRG